MRTNVDIDDALLAKAMQAGPFTTKKETVEAGLRLLERQAAYREILKWEGKLKWEGDESIDWTKPSPNDEFGAAPLTVQEPSVPYRVRSVTRSPAHNKKKAAVRAGR